MPHIGDNDEEDSIQIGLGEGIITPRGYPHDGHRRA
jgi:hypothetical protein